MDRGIGRGSGGFRGQGLRGARGTTPRGLPSRGFGRGMGSNLRGVSAASRGIGSSTRAPRGVTRMTTRGGGIRGALPSRAGISLMRGRLLSRGGSAEMPGHPGRGRERPVFHKAAASFPSHSLHSEMDGGYDALDGYGSSGGYAADDGYGSSGGYAAHDGYGSSGGYSVDDGYDTNEGYGAELDEGSCYDRQAIAEDYGLSGAVKLGIAGRGFSAVRLPVPHAAGMSTGHPSLFSARPLLPGNTFIGGSAGTSRRPEGPQRGAVGLQRGGRGLGLSRGTPGQGFSARGNQQGQNMLRGSVGCLVRGSRGLLQGAGSQVRGSVRGVTDTRGGQNGRTALGGRGRGFPLAKRGPLQQRPGLSRLMDIDTHNAVDGYSDGTCGSYGNGQYGQGNEAASLDYGDPYAGAGSNSYSRANGFQARYAANGYDNYGTGYGTY